MKLNLSFTISLRQRSLSMINNCRGWKLERNKESRDQPSVTLGEIKFITTCDLSRFLENV